MKLRDIAKINPENITRKDNYLSINYLDTANIIEGEIETIVEYSIDEAPSRAKRKAKNGDIIYSTVRPNLKHYGIIKGPSENLIVSTGFSVIRCNNNINKDYVYEYLTLPFITNKLASIAEGSVSTYPSIRPKDLENIEIKLPPLDIQNKITYIYNCFDKTIRNNRKSIRILEEIAEQIYKEWFLKFRFPGYKNSEFIDKIPKGWEKKKLSEFIIFERGVSYGSNDLEDGGYVLLSMNNIKPYGGFISDYSRLYCGKFKEHQLVKKGDLLMSITDMTQDRRIIGYTGLVGPGENNRIISMHLLKLHSEKYSNIFLNYLFNCSGLSRVIAERATGTNVLGMTVDILNNVKCILPPKDLANLYTEKVSPIINLIYIIEEKNNKLIEQRDLLLPRLMSGKLEIK